MIHLNEEQSCQHPANVSLYSPNGLRSPCNCDELGNSQCERLNAAIGGRISNVASPSLLLYMKQRELECVGIFLFRYSGRLIMRV